MGVRVKYDIDPEFVRPKLDDLDIETITLEDLLPDPTTPQIAPIVSDQQPSDTTEKSQGYKWFNWSLSLSLGDLEDVSTDINNFFDKIEKVGGAILTILKVMRLLSGNVKSLTFLLKFAVKALTGKLADLIDSFSSTGIYMSLVLPDTDRKKEKYTIPVWGGYQEFISRVNATCLSSEDPDAPKFDGENDMVGGFVIAMLGGNNNPSILKDMIHNYKRLGDLLGFSPPMPVPPLSPKATAGFYNRDGTLESGVKLVWQAPDAPVSHFFIYKTYNKNGKPIKIKRYPYQLSGDGKSLLTDTIYIPSDEPYVKIERKRGKLLYKYIDFHVSPGVLTHYKIYCVLGEDFLEDDANQSLRSVNSPIASPFLSAIPLQECIDKSELQSMMNQGINGELVGAVDLQGEWQSITVRGALGSNLDRTFRKIDSMTDKLSGGVSTGSDATNAYIKSVENKIGTLGGVLRVIQQVIDLILSFRLRGSFMVLAVPPAVGGMRAFVDRFNTASSVGSTEEGIGTKTNPAGEKSSSILQSNQSIAQFREKGIMMGVMLLTGFPGLSEDRLKEVVPEDEISEAKAKYAASQKAIENLLKILGLS